MTTMLGLGLAIGDQEAAVAGWDHQGGAWVLSEPALVSAIDESGQVELLLAGRETEQSAAPVLLQNPRQVGYAPGRPEIGQSLLAALLVTLRLQLPPQNSLRQGGTPVLVLPHTLSQARAEVVLRAAAEAGWGQVTPVSELTALAAFQAGPADGEITVAVPAAGWVHTGQFTVSRQDGVVHITLVRLTTVRPSGAAPPLNTCDLALGAARISTGAVVVAAAPQLSLTLMVVADGRPLCSFGSVHRTGRAIRALGAIRREGTVLQLAAGWQNELAACQVVGELAVDQPERLGGGGPDLLLDIEVQHPLHGVWGLRTPDGKIVRMQSYRVRLP
jgi:hypothetical protein